MEATGPPGKSLSKIFKMQLKLPQGSLLLIINIRMETTFFFRKNFNSNKLIRLGKRILVLLPCIKISKEEENVLIAPWCHN